MNPSTVQVDKLLTSVLVSYSNPELIGDILLPKVPVQFESGEYFVADKENLVEANSTRRALSGSANRVKGNLSTDTYALEEHTLEEWIDDRVLKNYQSPFDPRRNATNRLAGKLAISKEKEIIAALAAATSGANGVDQAGAWATPATDLRAVIKTGANTIHKATGVRPNTMVLDRLSLDAILSNTDFKASIAYTSDKTEENLKNLIAGYFDISRVVIAGGIQQTAATGGTGSFMWGTKGLSYLAYVNPTPAIEEVSAGYQFFKEDMTFVDVRREEGEKSDVVRSTDHFVHKIVDGDCLYRLYDTILT